MLNYYTNIVILTGAGLSAESGLSTFRDKDGVWTRHDLAEAVSRFDEGALRQMRETTADVGTGVTTRAETVRRSPFDVAQAGFKRLEEALRTLEEFGKIVAPAAAEWCVSALLSTGCLSRASTKT